MDRGIADTQFTLGDVIASGWDLYWKHLKNILPIFLGIYIPINIVLSFVPVDDWVQTYGRLRAFRMYTGIVRLTDFFVGVLATMALARLIEASFYGQDITWRQALRHAVSRWGAALLTGLLAGLIILGLLLLLIVPGIIWAVYYSFFVYVVALRGLSGKPALDHSKAIVQGQWWRVFGYLLVIALLNVLAGLALATLFVRAPDSRVIGVFSDTLSNLVSALFLTMIIVFFLNNDYLRMMRAEPAVASDEDSGDRPPGTDSGPPR